MKRLSRSLFAAMLVALLASCPTPFDGDRSSSAGDDAGAAPLALPSDQVSDVGRSVAGPFTFETLHPVAVDLSVDLYAVDEAGALQSDPLPPDAATVLVNLETRGGSDVYAGRLRADGTLSAIVYLPAAPADMVLELSAAGFESRSVTIRDMVRYSRIERRMSMRQLSGASGAARSVSGLVDAGSLVIGNEAAVYWRDSELVDLCEDSLGQAVALYGRP